MVTSNDITEMSALAWGALGVVSCYYVVLVIAFRWGAGRVLMARYEPPAGISPSMAAYLSQNGECERAFAAGIISLAAQGYVRIDAAEGQFRVAKVRDADDSISEDESTLLTALFPKYAGDECEFSGTDPGRLDQVLRNFQKAIDDLACPVLLSPHTASRITGIAFSLAFLPSFAWAIHSASRTSLSIGALLYFCIWIALGAVCLTAALRLWPATIRKIMSRLPGTRHPRHPFEFGDANPALLTISALFGFALLATITSTNFAILILAIVVVSSASRPLLEAPTRKGKKVLSELRDFKEFLARTEADRLSRTVLAQESPLKFERISAYAVALEIERGKGEEFATQMLQALEFNRAYSFGIGPPRSGTGLAEDHFLQLNLHGDRKVAGNSSRKSTG